MATYKRSLRIVVASPGDVQAERDTVEKVTAELNRSIAADRNLFFEVTRWETDAFPGFHPEGPQGLIDSILHIEDCDLLICIFWKRFGTPVRDPKSGTEHEFRTAYESWRSRQQPQIMMYFNEKPYTPKTSAEAEQWTQVLKFRENFPQEGLWWTYKGKDEFEGLVRNHLTQFIRHMPVAESPQSTSTRIADLRTSNPSGADRPNNYIPFPRNPLFQPRPGEFERLEHLLFNPETQQKPARLGLVGVVGMGGVGKTQLAVELAYRYQERFPSGVFWMPATGATVFDWQRHFAELAFNTGYLPPNDDLSSPENESRRARHFCHYLAQHADALLILDNVEDPNLVMTALPTLAGGNITCPILYTSRNTSTPPGTTTHAVERLKEEGSLRLLLETTRPALLGKVLSGSQDIESQSACSVCRGVGYLPLALVHLRGLLARDQRLTLVRLAEVLKQRGAFDIAKTHQGDAAPLFATFWLSWEKVWHEGAQRLFKLACYFPEATPIPLWLLGLAAGLGESGDIFEPLGEALLQLQELSLIEELSGDQIRLHPLVRAFGQRLVDKDGDKGKILLQEAGWGFCQPEQAGTACATEWLLGLHGAGTGGS